MNPSRSTYTFFQPTLRRVSRAAIAALVAGCDLYGFAPPEPRTPTGSDALEQVILDIEMVPAGVRCVRVSATGGARTESRHFEAAGGMAMTQGLSGLPLGTVTFLGEAFETPCSDVRKTTVPAWVSAPVETSIVLGRTTRVKLDMARNGRANVDVSWTEEAACTAEGAACRTNGECCSKTCQQDLCVPAPPPETPPG